MSLWGGGRIIFLSSLERGEAKRKQGSGWGNVRVERTNTKQKSTLSSVGSREEKERERKERGGGGGREKVNGESKEGQDMRGINSLLCLAFPSPSALYLSHSSPLPFHTHTHTHNTREHTQRNTRCLYARPHVARYASFPSFLPSFVFPLGRRRFVIIVIPCLCSCSYPVLDCPIDPSIHQSINPSIHQWHM